MSFPLRASFALSFAVLGIGQLCAQLVLEPTGSVERPKGNWADTVIVTYDVALPLAGFRRIDASGTIHTTHLVLAEHPSAVFKRMLGQGLVAIDQPGALLLKVNRLHMDEMGKRTSCSLHAEVIERSEDGFRRLHEGTVTVLGDRCRSDLPCYEKLFLNSLLAFFLQYEDAIATDDGRPGPLEASELSVPFRVDPSNTPILGDQPPRRGMYRSYLDMRMDRPDSLYNFELRETVSSPGGLRVVKVKHMSAEAEEQYWGLCTGKHPYVRVGDEFHRLDRTGNGYTASVPQPATSDPAAIGLGALFFGALGAGVAAATTTTATPPILFDLDMLSGGLVPHDRSRETLTYAQHIFHITRFAKSEAPMTLTCDGDTITTLLKNQWTSFSLPPRATKSRVVLTNGNSEAIFDIDTNTDRLEVHLIDVKRNEMITVSTLKEQMRNAVLDDLRTEDRRP
ncbi:MAG: hypothetical protein JNL43_07810 [Flavobacteriales bacterium]|nr:hypothetical protein [Flavobacteriales bacterium]